MFDIWRVLLEKRAAKSLENAPKQVKEKFEKWKDIVQQQGPLGLSSILGFRDHALSGEWKGARSSRLSFKWRVIYYLENRELKVVVVEVTAHDYRKKT